MRFLMKWVLPSVALLALLLIISSLVYLYLDEDSRVEHHNVCFDLSPDGLSIVFSSADGDLFLFDLSTKVASRLTETDWIESCPSFSPDGNSVLFVAAKKETAPCGIRSIRLADRRMTELTSPVGQSDYYPRYTPDGAQIVFIRSYRQRGYSLGGWIWDNWEVCLLDADGSNFEQLTNESYYRLYRVVPKQDGTMIYSGTGWGDDLSTLVFSLSPPQEPVQLLPQPENESADVNDWGSDAMISPDEKSLTFCSDREKPFWYDVCVMSEDGVTKGLLGSEGRYNRYPDFTPSGQSILFLRTVKLNFGNRSIYALWEVTLDGQLTEIAPDSLFTHPENWLRTDATDGPENPANRIDAEAESTPEVRS